MNKLPAILVLIATALPVALSAAVPLRWTVETNRIQPAQFEAFHGETLELAATMQSYGKPLAITNDLIGIYWQTNGMGSAYWTAPAVLSNNVMTARWTPSMDVGANVYSCFIGAPGEIYRAAFQLRLRPSPGAVPSELPLPVKTLDFAQVQVLNAPYYSKSETDARIIELAPAPGNYATVSNRAMTAVQPTAISDMETQTHAAATYQPKGSYLTSETDPSVDGKISDHNSNHDAHDDIRDELWNIHEDISAKADNDMVNSGFEIIYANFPDRVEMDDSIDDKISAHNTSINAHTDIRAALSDKQDVIADLNTIRSGAALGATALQSYTETDPTVPSWAKATTKPSYSGSEISLTGVPGDTVQGFAEQANMMLATMPSTSTPILSLNDGNIASGPGSTVLSELYISGEKVATENVIEAHDASETAHADIRQSVSAKYSKPSSGIPKTDLASAVQTSLGKADSALQAAHNTSTTAHTDIRAALSDKQDVIADLNTIRSGAALGATALQSYTETDPTVPSWAKATSKPTYTWNEIGSKPTTLVGYGITDAYTKAQVDTALNAKSDKFNVNGVAPDNGNVDVKEIYNSNKTQKIDGDGNVYVGEANTGGSWRHTNGAVMYYFNHSGSVYAWRTADGRQSVSYSSENGNVSVTGNYYGTIQTGLNPLNGDDLGAVTSGVNIVTFTKQQTQFPDGPTTRLAKLNDIPTALKCPNALTINVNGTTAATYDGSAARTVDITTGGGAPEATVASAALEYHADGQAISVSVAAAGTLTAVVNSWTDGQSQMAFVTLAAGASIAPAIKLIGYSEWPIGEEFMAVCTKRGSKIYVNPVCITEE